MKQPLHNFFIGISILFCFLLTSCSKGDPQTIPANTNPTITSLSVSTGVYNTSVLITGTNFSSTITNNQVFFSGKAATVTAATTTQLTAIVPLSAGTGAVTVTVNGTTATGPIFKYQLTEVVSTLAGSGAVGSVNGTGSSASFSAAYAIAVDVSGNIFVADKNNHLIRKVTAAGVVTTLAGSGATGAIDGVGTAASFYTPVGITIDPSGNIFVADIQTNLIRKITAAGVVTTFAGSGSLGPYNGIGTAASFYAPCSVASDASGNLYVVDNGGLVIRKITPTAVVSTFAGSGNLGSADGLGNAASFSFPIGVATDATGNVYVADGANLIRKITSAGLVTTFAGSGKAGATNATGTAASFNSPNAIATDAAGNVYVADKNNYLIRKISPSGVVTTFAGNGLSAYQDGVSTQASFVAPLGVATDASGNVYVADNNCIRKISLQ